MEGAVRTYSWLFFPKMMVVDPVLGWAHATNHSKTFTTEGTEARVVQNALGMRGPMPTPAKSPDRARVLVVGDSFTEAVQVDENDLFTARIATAHARLEVLNAGVGGYSTVQKFLYLRERGFTLKPDIVLAMYFGNDLTDNCLSFYPAIGPRPYATMEQGRLRVIEDAPADDFLKYALPLPFAELLNRYSVAYNFLNTRIYQPLHAERLREMRVADLRKAEQCPRLPILMALFAEMDRTARAAGARLLVALIPSREDARAGQAADIASILPECAAIRVACLSLLEPLHAAYQAGRKPYFDGDIHWNSAGHAVAAAALAPFIMEAVAPE